MQRMKTFPVTFPAVLMTTFLAACSPVRVDPNRGLPTGILTVQADAGNQADTTAVISNMNALALQYPRRPAFETTVMQQIRTGTMKVNALAITYADGSSRVFK